MKFYFKLFLLSAGVGAVNILIFIFLLQFQIVHNSGYIPQELVTVGIILIAIPIQFYFFELLQKNYDLLKTSGSGVFKWCDSLVIWNIHFGAGLF